MPDAQIELMRIGMSLSGGGVRATVYHLGVLKRLAESGRWSELIHLSTVSGGSLCIGLIFAQSGGRWPDTEIFLEETLTRCHTQLTQHSLIKSALKAGIMRPDLLLGGRAHLMGSVLRKEWGLDLSLADLPSTPRWTINSTTYETGKNWRFSHKRMGDYLTGYVMNPDFPVADAVASSAGFPGGIGPLKIDATRWKWRSYVSESNSETEEIEPLNHRYHLWDGGVYENLGSEALYKPGRGLRSDIDFYIASDAGKLMGSEFSRWRFGIPPYRPPLRLLDCAMDQVRAIRARALHGYLRGESQAKGLYLQIGQDERTIFQQAGIVEGDLELRFTDGEVKAAFAAEFPTTLRRLGESEYDMIFNHGYEVADATVRSWVPDF